jgi:hypothetical protein
VRPRRDRYQVAAFALVALGLALVALSAPVPVTVAAFVLGAVCVVGSVRGWRFPGQAPEPEQRLSRKAARHVRVEPTWSLDFLEPVVSRSVPDAIPFSGTEPTWTTFGAVPVRHAQRFGAETMEGIGAELAFFTDDGRVLYERVPARWRSNPFPEVRGELAPEVRRLPADETVEPIEVVARVDEEAAAYVHTADAARGGKQLLLAPGVYLVRLRITDAPDEPYVWYGLDVPVIAGLELRGPVRAPSWAPVPKPRPPAGPRIVPKKRQGSRHG